MNVLQNLGRIEANDARALRPQPSITSSITQRPPTHRMTLTVNFDDQHRAWTVEVDDIRTKGMLAPEFRPFWPLSKNLPQHPFGERHVASQRTRPQHDFVSLPS